LPSVAGADQVDSGGGHRGPKDGVAQQRVDGRGDARGLEWGNETGAGLRDFGEMAGFANDRWKAAGEGFQYRHAKPFLPAGQAETTCVYDRGNLVSSIQRADHMDAMGEIGPGNSPLEFRPLSVIRPGYHETRPLIIHQRE
jgi:hypothetical protein